MKKLISIFPVCILLFWSLNSYSQDYRGAVGLRLGGFTSGVSIKGFVSKAGAVEGIAGFGRRSFITTGLYEHHFPIPKVPGLQLYLGGGGHIGFFGDNGTYLIYKNKGEKLYVTEGNKTVVGADFIFGSEYKFREVPVVVGMDFKPFVDFYEGPVFYPDVAINVRFTF